MTPTHPTAVPIYSSTKLSNNELTQVFDLQKYGQPARAFVLRFEGRVVGYLNRCAHVPAEMDWQPGHFLDDSGRWILCSIHGAAYDPATGYCVAGPCAGRSLTPVKVSEVNGRVLWNPDARLQPASPDRTTP